MRKIIIRFWQLTLRLYLRYKRNIVPLTSRVDSNCTLTDCVIGEYCFIRSGAQFNHVVTGNYCSFAADVQIGGMEHPLEEYSTSAQIYRDKCLSNLNTILGNDVWVAAGAIIRQGVKIGDGAVIGANSFVNKDVPPYAIVAGSPAKIIKYIFEDSVQKQIVDSEYWKYPPTQARVILDLLKQNNSK